MAKNEKHIDYSNLPDDLVAEPKRVDMRPKPGQDGHEFDRVFQPGKSFESAQIAGEQFEKACENDSKVFFEVMGLLDGIEGWVTRKAIDVRSKPARDLLYDLQDWVEQSREDVNK